jgi:hypothetical protein
VLADGSTKDTLGTCKVKLQVQKHCSEVILNVTDLVSGFDAILGNDWSQQHCVEAKFGGLGSRDSHLYVRRTKTRIYPLRPALIPRGDVASAVLVPNLLSAVQVKRLLKKGTPRGCESPFMVIVREQVRQPSPVHQEKLTIRSTSLDALLNEYSHVFEAPRFGASQNAVRECIELEPEARPPNRHAIHILLCECACCPGVRITNVGTVWNPSGVRCISAGVCGIPSSVTGCGVMTPLQSAPNAPFMLASNTMACCLETWIHELVRVALLHNIHMISV